MNRTPPCEKRVFPCKTPQAGWQHVAEKRSHKTSKKPAVVNKNKKNIPLPTLPGDIPHDHVCSIPAKTVELEEHYRDHTNRTNCQGKIKKFRVLMRRPCKVAHGKSTYEISGLAIYVKLFGKSLSRHMRRLAKFPIVPTFSSKATEAATEDDSTPVFRIEYNADGLQRLLQNLSRGGADFVQFSLVPYNFSDRK